MRSLDELGQLSLSLSGLLLLYWGIDHLLRRGLWGKCGAQWLTPGAFLALNIAFFSALAPALRYGASFPIQMRAFACGVSVLLAWNAATRDLDPTRKDGRGWAQLAVLPFALLSYFSPAFLILTGVILSHFLRFWLHHATFPLRVLLVLISSSVLSVCVDAWALLPGASTLSGLVASPAPTVFLLVVVQISHYFITALAKGLLGTNPLSWVTDNKLHYLAASAYSWGWGRFLPWEKWKRLVWGVRSFERPLQLLAFSLEALCPLALLHPTVAIAFCLALASFHMGVFILSGLLFWDWILVDLFIALLLVTLPPQTLVPAFGAVSLALGLLVLGLFPLRHRLWKPMPLGWFDTPLTARIHWEVTGKSGKRFGLYNDFMCPHERLYGRVHGCFYAPYPLLTYHLGEVWKGDLRAAIERAGPDPIRLQPLRKKYGILPNSPELRKHHETFLAAFFAHLNAGARKSALPVGLRFLKAPGDQIFYWGDHEPYRGQEEVREVHLRFVEEYFDGSQLVRLHDEEVAQIRVPDRPPETCPEELTPKQLDDYLLGLAAGRLIDLPGFKRRYTDVLTET